MCNTSLKTSQADKVRTSTSPTKKNTNATNATVRCYKVKYAVLIQVTIKQSLHYAKHAQVYKVESCAFGSLRFSFFCSNIQTRHPVMKRARNVTAAVESPRRRSHYPIEENSSLVAFLSEWENWSGFSNLFVSVQPNKALSDSPADVSPGNCVQGRSFIIRLPTLPDKATQQWTISKAFSAAATMKANKSEVFQRIDYNQKGWRFFCH